MRTPWIGVKPERLTSGTPLQHLEPDATLNASRPSFAAPASSPSASCTNGGSLSIRCRLAATDAADTVFMVVSSVLEGLGSHLSRLQPERRGREDRRLKFYEPRDNLAVHAPSHRRR